MKLTKASVQFILDHPECGPFIISKHGDGNAVNRRAREIAANQLSLKVRVSREKFILVDPQNAQAQNVWKLRLSVFRTPGVKKWEEK